MNPATYVGNLKLLFNEYRNDEEAQAMSKYMRNLFLFYGIKKPQREMLTKSFWQKEGLPNANQLSILSLLLWQEPERELHYFALDTIQRLEKQLPISFYETLEQMIINRSWWDSVDYIASIVGKYFQRYPELIPVVPSGWINSDNIWLQRVAILFQLKYKAKTNTAILFSYILQQAHSKEFFIQKAMGWALREYSKTDAKTVIDFVKTEDLPSLTKREALKWLENQSFLSH